jgi:WD40 repeat protein
MNRYLIHERQTGELIDESPIFSHANRSRIIRQLQALRPTSNSSTVVPKSSAKYEITSLHEQLQRRRLIFESSINRLSSNYPDRFNLTIYYGDAEGWFKCPKEQCFAFYEGFTSAESRDQHHEKHLRPHLCSYSGCIYATLGFTNFNELKRHQSNAHPILLEEAAVEFPHSEKSMAGHKNKITKSSTDGQFPEESPDMLLDSKEEEFEFPAPDVAKPTLSGNEGVIHDAASLIDKPSTVLLKSTERNTSGFPSFQPILYEYRGKPPTSSSRQFSGWGAPRTNTIESLITEINSINFDGLFPRPPVGYTARMCPEEKWIAVSTYNTPKQANELDVDLRFTFQHESVVCALCFSADGKLVATGSNKVVRLFNTTDGSVLYSMEFGSTYPVKENYCRSICFDPSAKLLATAWGDKIIRILDVRTGLLRGELMGHDQDICDIDIGRDGCTMASGSGDKTVRVWDIRNLQNKMILYIEDGVTSGRCTIPEA